MTCDEWERLAKERLLSGEMSDEEWKLITGALLVTSETYGIDGFDEAIEAMSNDPRWAKE